MRPQLDWIDLQEIIERYQGDNLRDSNGHKVPSACLTYIGTSEDLIKFNIDVNYGQNSREASDISERDLSQENNIAEIHREVYEVFCNTGMPWNFPSGDVIAEAIFDPSLDAWYLDDIHYPLRTPDFISLINRCERNIDLIHDRWPQN